MKKTVGIPRGLFFYRFYPLWKRFFDELGVKTIVSNPSNKRIMDLGIKISINEACLPVKLFHAHVMELKDKVDYIFVPRYTSLSKNEYVCPKFGGISDMVKSSLDDIPEIIDVEVNMRKSKIASEFAAIETGLYFTNDIKAIKQAYFKAINTYRVYKKNFSNYLLPDDMVKQTWKKAIGHPLRIFLLGHSYNVYDSFLNMGIVDKIRDFGVDVLTLEMLDGEVLKNHTSKLYKPLFWEYGTHAIGGIYDLIENLNVDGIIYLMCFGCGIDSFVFDMAKRRVRNASDIPFTTITLDEQSGQAGLNTRLEAFIDTLKWRKNGSNISVDG